MLNLMLLLSGTIFILLLDLFLKGKKQLTLYLVEILLLATIPFASTMQIAFLILTFLIVGYARGRDEFEGLSSEFLFLILFSLMGAMVIAEARSLLTLYLGLELLSLPLYALIALERERPLCGEAAIKYFVMGALASAFLLFGFSILYGLTGTIELSDLSTAVISLSSASPAYSVVIVMVLVGIVFKLGLVPFHLWVSDVYEGAPLPVTVYLATVPKLAMIAFFMRLFSQGLGFSLMMHEVLLIVGVLSLVIGNCAALVQTSLRRLLAFSAVGNMGWVAIALSLFGHEALMSAVFYAISYAFATAGMFGLLLCFRRDIATINDLRGLHQQRPYLAFLFLLVILSIIGLPPLLGFDGKLLILMVFLHQGYLFLAILGVVMSVVAAAYYLKIVKALYFEPSSSVDFKISRGFSVLCLNVNAWALLVLGLFPGALMFLIERLSAT